MGKRIQIKPVEALTLGFPDGTEKDVMFTTQAMAIMDEELEGSLKILRNIVDRPHDTGSKVLYAGMKVVDPNITLADVQALIASIGIDSLMEILEFAAESFYGSSSAALKKTTSQ